MSPKSTQKKRKIVQPAASSNEPPKTLSVPEAGRRYFGKGRNASYAASRNGQIPTIEIGRLRRVPVVAMERILNEARPKEPAPGTNCR